MTGKSTLVKNCLENLDHAFVQKHGAFFHNYTGQKVMVFDDMPNSEINNNLIKLIGNHTNAALNMKGRSQNMSAELAIFISNYAPTELELDEAALTRFQPPRGVTCLMDTPVTDGIAVVPDNWPDIFPEDTPEAGCNFPIESPSVSDLKASLIGSVRKEPSPPSTPPSVKGDRPCPGAPKRARTLSGHPARFLDTESEPEESDADHYQCDSCGGSFPDDELKFCIEEHQTFEEFLQLCPGCYLKAPQSVFSADAVVSSQYVDDEASSSSSSSSSSKRHRVPESTIETKDDKENKEK